MWRQEKVILITQQATPQKVGYTYQFQFPHAQCRPPPHRHQGCPSRLHVSADCRRQIDIS